VFKTAKARGQKIVAPTFLRDYRPGTETGASALQTNPLAKGGPRSLSVAATTSNSGLPSDRRLRSDREYYDGIDASAIACLGI
jgi:hypothetical protein